MPSAAQSLSLRELPSLRFLETTRAAASLASASRELAQGAALPTPFEQGGEGRKIARPAKVLALVGPNSNFLSRVFLMQQASVDELANEVHAVTRGNRRPESALARPPVVGDKERAARSGHANGPGDRLGFAHVEAFSRRVLERPCETTGFTSDRNRLDANGSVFLERFHLRASMFSSFRAMCSVR
jgi:hypothetical protein